MQILFFLTAVRLTLLLLQLRVLVWRTSILLLQLISPKETHISNVMYHFLNSKYVCVGSPTLNSKFLPTASSFLTHMAGLSPKNDHHIGFAFGSYGWSPLGPKMIQTELEAVEFTMPLPVHAIGWIPFDEDLDAFVLRSRTWLRLVNSCKYALHVVRGSSGFTARAVRGKYRRQTTQRVRCCCEHKAVCVDRMK